MHAMGKSLVGLFRNHPVATVVSAWGAQLGLHLAELEASVQLATAILSLVVVALTLALKVMEWREKRTKKKAER